MGIQTHKWAPFRYTRQALPSTVSHRRACGSPFCVVAGDAHARDGVALRSLELASMSTDDWQSVIDALSPFMKDSRYERLVEVLSRRRGGVHLVLENISDPFNCAAVMRTAEGLGVQHVHVIESVCEFRQPAAETSHASRGALGNVAMGASRWLSVRKYESSIRCFEQLRQLKLRVLASDCPPLEAEDAGGFGWQTAKAYGFRATALNELRFERGPGVALVLGNERRGVSRAFLERADGTFYVPMCGLTQSFNISVAAAVALYAVLASGAFPEGSLPEDERTALLGRWCLRDVKAAKPLLRKAGIELIDF